MPNKRLRSILRTTSSRVAIMCLLLPAVAMAAEDGASVELGRLQGEIVFSSDRSGSWRIWAVNADGTSLRQVTQDEGDVESHDVDPMFSPAGDAILFSSTRGGQVGVWTIPTGGGTPARICDGDQAEWSPDGKAIALRRDNRVWLRDMASGEEKGLSPEEWPTCSGPAWSPDGETIAFAARWDAGNGIYVASRDGGKPEKIYDKKGACEPHFTPDGRLIVYETETNICTIQPDGQKNRMVTYQGGVQRYGRASPDGEYIVYCQGLSERGPWELYVVPTKGGYPVRLTEGGSDMNPDWRQSRSSKSEARHSTTRVRG